MANGERTLLTIQGAQSGAAAGPIGALVGAGIGAALGAFGGGKLFGGDDGKTPPPPPPWYVAYGPLIVLSVIGVVGFSVVAIVIVKRRKR